MARLYTLPMRTSDEASLIQPASAKFAAPRSSSLPQRPQFPPLRCTSVISLCLAETRQEHAAFDLIPGELHAQANGDLFRRNIDDVGDDANIVRLIEVNNGDVVGHS